MSVRVSVVIPCFNYGRYLRDAVESVLASTLRDHEVIVVDDGSTDDSREVAKSLIAEHPGAAIQLISQPNCGVPGAVRNLGIARARGEYILCLDADDKLHPGFLEACVSALDARPQAGIAYCDFQMFDESDTLQQPPAWNARVELDCNFLGSASMFRRRAWEQVGGYDGDAALVGYEDWDFWVGCIEQGFSGVKAGGLWYYRVHGGSIYSTHVRRDHELKARIILKHPSLYCEGQLRWARGVLSGDAIALSAATQPGWMPPWLPSPQRPPSLADAPPPIDSICLISRDFAAQAQARLLAARGVDVHVITESRAGAAGMWEDAGVVVHELPVPQLAVPQELDYLNLPVWSYIAASRFAQLDATARFDIVEVADVRGEALHLSPRAQTALVVRRHDRDEGPEAPRSPAEDARRALEKAAVERADLVLPAADTDIAGLLESYAALMAARGRLPKISGARSNAVVAFAEELVADPELLHGWAQTFGGIDEVTLVIHAPGWSPQEADLKLRPLVERAGLDGDDAADLLALVLPACERTETHLAAGARAILSRRRPSAPFDRLITVDETSLSALRESMCGAAPLS